MDTLAPLSSSISDTISPYLPPATSDVPLFTPFVTLTYAQLLDSKIAAAPGSRTAISGPESKAMTHYLRSRHDAILVGAGTARADDPRLSCRYKHPDSDHVEHPRPVVLDPQHTWKYSRLLMQSAYESGLGKAPFIIVSPANLPHELEEAELAADGGRFIVVDLKSDLHYYWQEILVSLAKYNIRLVMIEGGARLINDLLPLPWVDSLIVTVGPVFLGQGGVSVSPETPVRLTDVEWWTGDPDLVMCARVAHRKACLV